jgi:hypothetical protein
VDMIAFIVTVFQNLYAELISFVGEKPLLAALAGAGLLAIVAVPELRHQRRANRARAAR